MIAGLMYIFYNRDRCRNFSHFRFFLILGISSTVFPCCELFDNGIDKLFGCGIAS